MKIEQAQLPEANFIQCGVCPAALASVVEGILVEFGGINWSLAHTPIAVVRAMIWVPEELFYNELDEEVFAGLQSRLVPSSSKSVQSSLDKTTSKTAPSRLSHCWISSVPSRPFVMDSPPSLPFPPSQSKPSSSYASSQLFPFSSLASPVVQSCCTDPPGASQSSVPPWLMDPSAPPQASKPRTPLLPSSRPLAFALRLHHGFFHGTVISQLCSV